MDKTGLSSCYAVVAAVDCFIMMINISEKPAFLRKGSVVGRVEEVSSVTHFDVDAPLLAKVLALLSRQSTLSEIEIGLVSLWAE